MAGSGRKVFAAGQVLSGVDIQNYLQDQAVMVFASAAARSSGIATPTEGMVTYLKDVDKTFLYNGTSWVQILDSTDVASASAAGVVSTGTQTFAGNKTFSGSISGTSASFSGDVSAANASFSGNVTGSGLTLIHTRNYTNVSSETISGVFSSTYNAYQIVISNAQNGSGNNDFSFTLTSGGSPAASQWAYNNFGAYGNGTSFVSSSVGAGAGTFQLTPTTGGSNQSCNLIVNQPYLTAVTFIHGHSFSTSSGNGSYDGRINSGMLANNNSYDGFRLASSTSTISGTVRVYGLKN